MSVNKSKNLNKPDKIQETCQERSDAPEIDCNNDKISGLYIEGELNNEEGQTVVLSRFHADAKRVYDKLGCTAVSSMACVNDSVKWDDESLKQLTGKKVFIVIGCSPAYKIEAQKLADRLLEYTDTVYLLDMLSWKDVPQNIALKPDGKGRGLSDLCDLLGEECVMRWLNESMYTAVAYEKRSEDDSDKPKFNYGMYKVNDKKGVVRIEVHEKNGDATMLEIPVCAHPVTIKSVLRNIDTGKEKIRIYGKWTDSQDIIEKTVDKPRGIIFDRAKVIELADEGFSVGSENAKEMAKYLNTIHDQNRDILPIVKSSSHLGWVDDNKAFLPHNNNGIELDSESDFKGIYKALQSKGDIQKWVETIEGLIDIAEKAGCGTIVKVMLGASFASPLIEPFGGLPFYTHLYGESESGKTVALKAAASVWGDPSNRSGYLMNFRSTKVASEMIAGFLNSIPLCMDELQLAPEDKNGQKLHSVYDLAEGQGKPRSNAKLGVREPGHWANSILTTGETPITTMDAAGGALNRVIELEIPSGRKMMNGTQGNKICLSLNKNYGLAGEIFVKKIMEDGFFNKIRPQYYGIAEEFVEKGTTDKQAQVAALISIAFRFANNWFFEDEYSLNIDDIVPYMVSQETIDTGKQGTEALIEWCFRNKNHFEIGNTEAIKTESYGWADGRNYTYIYKNVFEKIACKDIKCNAKQLARYMRDHGYTEVNNGLYYRLHKGSVVKLKIDLTSDEYYRDQHGWQKDMENDTSPIEELL